MSAETWAAVSAVGSLVSAAIAAYNGRIAYRTACTTRAADLLLKFEHQFFEGERMRRTRTVAARKLLAKDPDNPELDDVLDFFETLGLMLSQGAVETKLVWSSFHWWLEGYCHAAEVCIAEARRKDRTVWNELEALRRRLAQYEHQRNPGFIMRPEAVEVLLHEEAALLGENQG